MALWTRLFALMGGGAVAAAAAKGAEPTVELVAQDAYKANPFKVLDPGTLGALIAQALIESKDATDQAARSGFDSNKLNAYVQLALKAPDVSEALALWRRGRITEAQVDHALAKSQLEPQYHAAVKELEFARLDPAVIATAIQRTVLPNPGILPNQPSTAGSNVPPMPTVDLDPIAEAFASGVTRERLEAETRIVGLPASPDLAARMHFRGIVTEGAYNQAILEGNTRGEWAPFLLDGFRQILTAHEYAELELRGFLTTAERVAGTNKWGMSKADSDLLYDVLGRAIAEHQIVTGEARGGVYNGPIDHIPEAFLSALRRGNIRPEYYNIAYANRYSYPSAFVLRSLTQAGDITEAEAHQILLNIGWPPDLAEKVAAHWAGGTGASPAADPLAKKAQSQLWTALHKAYVDFAVDEGTAANTLTTLGAADPSIVLGLWDRERLLVRTELTTTQIKKAYVQTVLSEAEATTKLEQLGMTAADIHTLLHS